MKHPATPVAIGQRRRDPDPRMGGRIVEVVGLGYSAVSGSMLEAALVRTDAGRETRIRVDRLERWPLAEAS